MSMRYCKTSTQFIVLWMAHNNIYHTHISAVTVPYARPSRRVFAIPTSKAAPSVGAAAPIRAPPRICTVEAN